MYNEFDVNLGKVFGALPDGDYVINFDSILDFYKESEIQPIFNMQPKNYFQRELVYYSIKILDTLKEDDKRFMGLSLQDIHKYKFGYTPGIELLRELNNEFNIGGKSFDTRWNDQDGAELSMERLYEGLPAMLQRVQKIGNNHGRFVNIHVNVTECGCVTTESMLKKTYFVANLTDALEKQAYRVAINMYHIYCHGVCTVDFKQMNSISLITKLKNYNEPLNLSLLLYALSPWMFRYWSFKLICGHFPTMNGLGQPGKLDSTSTISDIYINSGECLTENSCNEKLEEIKRLHNFESGGMVRS